LSKSAWQLLGDYLKDTQLLGSIQSTLYWDQNTSMPIAGSTWRGEQLSLLAKQLHARQSSEQFEILIKEAKSELQRICWAKLRSIYFKRNERFINRRSK